MPARFVIIDRANGFTGEDAARIQMGLQESLRRVWVAWRHLLIPQFRDYAPSVSLWGDSPLPDWDHADPMLASHIPVWVYDEQASTDALGYHFQAGIRPEASVFVSHGSGVRTGHASLEETIAHEMHEVLVNPWLDEWVPIPGKPGWWTPRESDDPTQEHYTLDLGERLGSVRTSNAVYPAYFGLPNHPDVDPGQLDELRSLSAPFEIGPQGYRVETDGIRVDYAFGAQRDGFSATQTRTQARPLARTRRLVDAALCDAALRACDEGDS